MTKRKKTKAFTSLCPKIFKIKKTTKTKDVQWWLRAALVTSRRQLQGGFVLPTTVMVILVVVLVVTTLVFRSFNRTTQIIGERQQQVIYNAATPAIDRAKSKLENLFRNDTRLPAGVPSDTTLEDLLKKPANKTEEDIYTIADGTKKGGEERLSFAKDPNAAGWYYEEKDQNGNVNRIVAYSINFKKQVADPSDRTGTKTLAKLQDKAQIKADYSVVRNGPVNAINAGNNPCGGGAIKLTANERDWEPISSATLAKTFQVTAVAIDNPGKPNQTLTTLELQQDRQADKGNKWGAYFRYDLELFNLPQFNWNGAMRSDGNIFLGPFGDTFKAHLISAPNSCVNTSPNDSRISIGEYRDQGRLSFQGQIVAGRLGENKFGGGSDIHLFTSVGGAPNTKEKLTSGTDSILEDATIKPVDLALEPIALFTEDKFKARGAVNRDPKWDKNPLKKRIVNENINPPYLDDTYRADNRYGPNPNYDKKTPIPVSKKVGDSILASDKDFLTLTRDTSADPIRNPDAIGLDGYWERRAVKGGLRVIVGQRLELGAPLPNPNDPVTSMGKGIREHEFLQRRNQRNNLAAAQSTTVYHYQSGDGLTPVACVATTVHPGTADTLKRSATFESMDINGTTTLVTDFFNGRGTNGWEFETIAATGPSANMLSALDNLTNSSSDPNGAFPPVQVAGTVRPSPQLTPYGDFSNLRRARGLGAYASLSIADRSYIDTAACSLGMLAYNINYLQSYQYSNSSNSIELGKLDQALKGISNTAAPKDRAEFAIAQLSGGQQRLARLIATREQVEHSRWNGVHSPSPTTGYKCEISATYPNLASQLCVNAAVVTPKYPSLFYIFPKKAHVVGSQNYNVVDPATIQLKPKPPKDWLVQPDTTISTTAATRPGVPNSNATGSNNLVQYSLTPGAAPQYLQVPFKDAAMFNGREMMSKRVLDIDLNLLRKNKAPGGDYWIPVKDDTGANPSAPPPTGVIYAFREDAVREDGIARPPSSGTDNKNYMTKMDANPLRATDPDSSALNKANNGISIKPVDYLPDPDRRPNGFRLKNGSDLRRGTSIAGMSFISDNTVYIYGDFNLHSTDGTKANLIEEFEQKLKDDWGNFYERKDRKKEFAKPESDTWRPAEVLGDSVSVLSGNFCDGSIEDGIIYAGVDPKKGIPAILPALKLGEQYGCDTSADYTSYLNQNRPTVRLTNLNGVAKGLNDTAWVRENLYDPTSPIKISGSGEPRYINSLGAERSYELARVSGSTPESYLTFKDKDPFCNIGGDSKCMGKASPTIVNSIIIQAIVPSRVGQPYGGFHNFPRLIENWDRTNLNMAGSFIQLRFSTQATGPYDHNGWEPNDPNNTVTPDDEYITYYRPAGRRWGYDVALQYQTAGPVARRFSTPGNARSEIYSEIPIDDPYAKRIICTPEIVKKISPATATAMCRPN
jgi:hypothetical protein